MSLEESLAAFLLADADIRAVTSDRVHQLYVPEGGKYPAVAIQRISTTKPQPINGGSRIKAARVQVTSVARNHPAASDLADLIQNRLLPDGRAYRGAMGDYFVHNVTLMDEGTDVMEGTATNPLHPHRQDYEIWFS